MTAWKPTPRIKLYEALGAVADGRVEVGADDTGRVRSSDGAKVYEVRYDAAAGAIMTNDNASYWQGYLGYPGVAYLLARGVLQCDKQATEALRDIAWKALATQYRNDWDAVEAQVRQKLAAGGFDLAWFDRQLDELARELGALRLVKLGTRMPPPKAKK